MALNKIDIDTLDPARTIVVATGNAHKLVEIEDILSRVLPDVTFVALGQLGDFDDPEETGTTFLENALIKAEAAVEQTGMSAIADDSGLVVDALDGTGADPGTVFSFEPSDMACGAGMVSLHEVRFSDVLAAATFMGAACKARCFGAQVLDRGDGTMERGLSPRVEAAVCLVSRAVVRHLDDAWHADSRDLWRESGDPRALLDDARAYVRAALAACGVADEPATGMLDGVPSTMADYEADDLVSKLLEGV